MRCPFVASRKNISKILDGYDGEYPCLASRDHNNDHVVEVEPGKTLAIPKLAQGRPLMLYGRLSEEVMVRFTTVDVYEIDLFRGDDRSRSAAVRDCVIGARQGKTYDDPYRLPLSERVMVRMSTEDVVYIDQLRGDRSRSELMRDCVHEVLRLSEKDPKNAFAQAKRAIERLTAR